MKCPYDEHAPHSVDGVAAWEAAIACAWVDGMGGARVDIGAAVSAAQALGCDGEAAAPLVMSVASGLRIAQAKRREGERDERDG